MTLTPSDRVRIISEIGRRLGTSEWTLIDLTLRQFGLPWTDDWRGNGLDNYVMSMIQDGPDDVLRSLGRHLDYEFTTVAPEHGAHVLEERLLSPLHFAFG